MSSLRVNNRGVLKDICSNMLNTDDEIYQRKVGLVIKVESKEKSRSLRNFGLF